MKAFAAVPLLFIAAGALGGCGGVAPVPVCSYQVYVSPPTATADHAAPTPGNQQQFGEGVTVPAGCPLPPRTPIAANFIWSVSDPTKVSINSGNVPQNGLATCLAATSEPVTVSAEPARQITPALLTCK